MRVFILLLPLTFFLSSVSAQPLAVTNTFSNTTVADADQVNQNFSDIETWINGYIIVQGANTALGYQALINTNTLANGSGDYNTAAGASALRDNTTGPFNTAIGAGALLVNATAGSNTAIGVLALSSNQLGDENTAIGARTLLSNVYGRYNTAIGSGANVQYDSSNATAIGAGATVNVSNKIQLGNEAVTSVSTHGALTTGDVTYPNVDGQAGQVLTTDGNGVLGWADDAIPSTATSELIELIASLEEQLGLQREELLAVVRSQQEQIAQLQRMVEHQFAAK